MTDILEKLRGGDLRSIGRANEVAHEVENNSTLFGAVFSGLYDSDPVVRMRSADVIEKVTKNKSTARNRKPSRSVTRTEAIATAAKERNKCQNLIY